jgi:hypothetical protein
MPRSHWAPGDTWMALYKRLHVKLVIFSPTMTITKRLRFVDLWPIDFG